MQNKPLGVTLAVLAATGLCSIAKAQDKPAAQTAANNPTVTDSAPQSAGEPSGTLSAWLFAPYDVINELGAKAPFISTPVRNGFSIAECRTGTYYREASCRIRLDFKKLGIGAALVTAPSFSAPEKPCYDAINIFDKKPNRKTMRAAYRVCYPEPTRGVS